MANSAAIIQKVREWLDSGSDFLNEQVWFQELKGKWEELDPQSKTNLKFAMAGVGVLSVLLMILTSIWSVHSLKSELAEKRSLLNTIQSANDEVHRLKESTPSVDSGAGKADETGSWSPYFETVASTAGFDKSSLNVSSEKPGTSSDQSKELLYDLNLKHVNIKQVVRYAFSLETGSRPIKVRNLTIDTKGDPSGYLDATLAISAFSLVKHE